MNRTFWLASYPKSGNTWLRLLLANIDTADGGPVDINDMPSRGGIASARLPFESVSMIDSGLLTADEVDGLRPRIHAALAADTEVVGEVEDEDGRAPAGPLRLVKVHDAYTWNEAGEPLLAGARGARGAIVIVRDPRDVAPSFAHHNRSSIDAAIDLMNDPCASFSDQPSKQPRQLRQKLLTWSGHVASWLDQTDIPTYLIRYEDMKDDAVGTVRGALAFLGRPAGEDAIRRAVAHADFAELQRQEVEKGFAEATREGVPFFRRGAAGGWRDELDPAQAARIEAAHAPMMRHLGYDVASTASVSR